MSDDELRAGADRFSGFAGLYDDVRPTPPAAFGELIRRYLGGRADLVVDLGSGTGLSSRWAATWAGEVIGVEPSDDMRTTAEGHPGHPTATVSYTAGWSHDTGLADGVADVITVVQALHWMEPTATFAEAARLLRPGGVFAVIDCDFPPVVGDVAVERAWDECRRQMRVCESRLLDGHSGPALSAPIGDGDAADAARYSGIDAHRDRRLLDRVRSWSKSEHLERMIASQRFTWCRELAATAESTGSAERLRGLLRSQGDYQTLRRHGLDDEAIGVAEFDRIVTERLGTETHPWHVVYRARLGFT